MKSNFNKRTIRIIMVIVGVFIVYMYVNWELIQFKLGIRQPILWGEGSKGPVITIQNVGKPDKSLGIKMTDFYYLQDSKELNFGFWYSKFRYNASDDDDIPRIVFSISLKDQDHNIYTANSFVISTDMGMFENFQYRQASGVDFDSIEQLTMYIYPLRNLDDGSSIELEPYTMVVYDKNKE